MTGEKIKKDEFVFRRVIAERQQKHETRKELFIKLENDFNRPVVSFFTSFNLPVGIEDNDADMIASLLQMLNLEGGLIVIISSPGGDSLAAERIINIFRTFSGTGKYTIIVPGKAKSAATIVCFGSEKILMGPTSELGPVDPRVPIESEKGVQWVSAHHIVESYKELFNSAVKETKGNIEPYLQQLKKPYYDTSVIKKFESIIELSDDISIRALQSCMMKDKSYNEINEKLKMFLKPEQTKSHGRPIFLEDAKNCELSVDVIDPHTNTWKSIYELYIRTNEFVSSGMAKSIETKEYAFQASAPQIRS